MADLVWSRFGDVPNYCEPFAGSLAVLLGRPHPARVETVNDKDAYLANFWRALREDPEQVAWWADWPVNEADLHARHRWLVDEGKNRLERFLTDPDFFDAQIAGWWVWGQCLWIGSGWCARPDWSGRVNAGRKARGLNAASVRNADTAEQERRPHLTGGQGIKRREHEDPSRQRKRPHLAGHHNAGKGVHRKRFAGTGNGQGAGVHRRWQGGGQGGGSGVHAPTLARQVPDLSGDSGATGRGIAATAFDARTGGLYTYLAALSARLRRVRVCVGDWKRVLTPSVTTYMGVTGVLLDPPYEQSEREICYSQDEDISADVAAWAREHGQNPLFRIALCGYEGTITMPDTWECVPWKAHGGYSRSVRGKANRSRERIWFSPACLRRSDQLNFDHVEPGTVTA